MTPRDLFPRAEECRSVARRRMDGGPRRRLGTWGAALLAVLLGFGSVSARAEVIADWGAVITPVQTTSVFTFAESGITKNFTHDYLFSLEGSAGATYTVTFNLSDCTHGCGNVGVTYGIYDANGGLVATTTSGSVTLAVGDYSFRVKGTGMGAGNTLDYSGNVQFTAVANADVVSPAPEPSTYLLTLIGLTLVGWVGHRNRVLLGAAGGSRNAFGGGSGVAGLASA